MHPFSFPVQFFVFIFTQRGKTLLGWSLVLINVLFQELTFTINLTSQCKVEFFLTFPEMQYANAEINGKIIHIYHMLLFLLL